MQSFTPRLESSFKCLCIVNTTQHHQTLRRFVSKSQWNTIAHLADHQFGTMHLESIRRAFKKAHCVSVPDDKTSTRSINALKIAFAVIETSPHFKRARWLDLLDCSRTLPSAGKHDGTAYMRDLRDFPSTRTSIHSMSLRKTHPGLGSPRTQVTTW